MGKWQHRKPEPKEVQGICVRCKERPQKRKGSGFKSVCGICDSASKAVKLKNIRQTLIEKHGLQCRICGEAEKPLVLDHNHTSGMVRGLLCHQCNIFVGLLEYTPNQGKLETALRYLQEPDTDLAYPRHRG